MKTKSVTISLLMAGCIRKAMSQYYVRTRALFPADALAAHNTMSKQALASNKVRNGLREILLGPGQLYEALREQSTARR